MWMRRAPGEDSSDNALSLDPRGLILFFDYAHPQAGVDLASFGQRHKFSFLLAAFFGQPPHYISKGNLEKPIFLS